MRFESDFSQLVDLINSTFRSTEKRQEYVTYVSNLTQRNLPPLFSFSHIANVFGLKGRDLYDLAFKSKFHYSSFYIPKRTGGVRLISAPHAQLATIQEWIGKNILDNSFFFGDEVVGYVKKKNILDHVKPHVEADCVIKLDLKDFFPSISTHYVTKIFFDLGYSISVSRIFSELLTLDGSIPQGACTSPQVSNIRMINFDAEMLYFCELNNFKYTRYADDIVLSGSKELINHKGKIRSIFIDNGLVINHKKTRVYDGAQQVRFITGLIINDGTVRLPKSMRRKIRAESHALMKAIPYLRSGAKVEFEKLENDFLNDPLAIEKLLGKLNYWLQIEPGHKYPLAVKNRIAEFL